MDFFEALWQDIQKICGDTVALGTNNVTTLNIIVWSLFIGFVIGIAITVYNKFVLGPVVNGLINRKAVCEESAVPLTESGKVNPLVRFALRKNGTFRKIVRMKGDSDGEFAKGGIDTASFYIPEESIHRAEVLYAGNGMSLMSVLLAVLVFFAIALAAFIVVPDLISMLSNFIGSVTPDSKIL